MSHLPVNPPLPIRPSVDTAADGQFDSDAFAPLRSEPFAQAWVAPAAAEVAGRLRSRLLGRAAASQLAERGMVTVRRRRLARQALADGVLAQQLYAAPPGRPLRPGEPLRMRLIELASGAVLTPDLLGRGLPDDQGRPQASRCEWLVMSGHVWLGDKLLSARDYHRTPAGQPGPGWRADGPALLFLRESADALSPDPQPQAGPAEHAFTLRDADAGWPDFAPGIQRRVLWQQGGQAALLYFAQAGAQVPMHSHGHDEECLTLQGELYLDDLLLQEGDYQLAPAGSGHRITATDTGVVIYAHGDYAAHGTRHLLAAAGVALLSLPAQALMITASFDASYNAAQKATVNSAILYFRFVRRICGPVLAPEACQARDTERARRCGRSCSRTLFSQ